MKHLRTIIVILVLCFTVVKTYPRKHGSHKYERKRITSVKKQEKIKQYGEKAGNSTTRKASQKNNHKVYKKFGMVAAPNFALEDKTTGMGGVQQVLLPLNTAGYTSQNTMTSSPELVASFASSAPTQRNDLGIQLMGDQSVLQQGATEVVQPQKTQTVQYQGSPVGTNEDNSVLKTITQGTSPNGATIQETGAIQGGQIVGSTAGTVDAGSEITPSFSQTDELKDFDVYNGASAASQSKEGIEGVSPQEEVKIVNLGDDEKTASLQQDKSCGGCPTGAKCVDGGCQIGVSDAQQTGLTGLTGGKEAVGSATTISDIHELEAQELTSLIKDASKVDTPSTAVPESPTSSPYTTEYPTSEHDQQQVQSVGSTQVQKLPQTAQLAKQPQITIAQQKPLQEYTTTEPQQVAAAVAQPHFTGDQLRELRDFARMYKMYQFIRKMEERLNDPDCAPVCRKICKSFCPTKCCHSPKVNTNVVSHLMQTADKLKGSGANVKKPNGTMNDTKDDTWDNEDDEEKQMDKNNTGKKHILIRILKNDELDKPRR